jgi:integrase
LNGSVKGQVHALWNLSGINAIGTSKHEAKNAAREEGAKTWSDIGSKIGIHSYGTADNYRATWRDLLKFSKEVWGEKNIENLTPEIVREFLRNRADHGVAFATFQREAAACGKLEQALNLYSVNHNRGNHYDFQASIDEARQSARELRRFRGSRDYTDPRSLVSATSDSDHQTTAKIQLESGSRIHEASLIRKKQLLGYKIDPVTNQKRGAIHYKGKGGKVGEHLVSPHTYEAIEKKIEEDGEFRINKDSYLGSLRAAANITGQRYVGNGSHGLRWNFAQERFYELQKLGQTYDQALAQVSNELGHERAEITEHYLQ